MATTGIQQWKWRWEGNSISTVNLQGLPGNMHPNFVPSFYRPPGIPPTQQPIAHFLNEDLKLYTSNSTTYQKYKITFRLKQAININLMAQVFNPQTGAGSSNYGNLINNNLASLKVFFVTPKNTANWSNTEPKVIDIMTIDDYTVTSSTSGAWGTFTEEIDLSTAHDPVDVFGNPQPLYNDLPNSIVFSSMAGEGDSMEVPFDVDNNRYDAINWQGIIEMVSIERVAADDDGTYSGGDSVKAKVELEINSIEGTPPTVTKGQTSLRYKIDLYDNEEKLFEFKLPRFSYRYKYIDGEYSGFAPFSKVAFVPGGFDYHPKKGYNLGMTNTIKNLTLDGYASNMPGDVDSIDILYKEEDSPNIYIVDTVKEFGNQQYKIKSETLKNGITQSNQLLRHWDNVPRAAKSQEIIGNRIVYGNYLQNYNLLTAAPSGGASRFDPALNPQVISKKLTGGAEGQQSIKSLREYQVGVVYADKYGRQTPVLTNSGATFKVHKNKAESQNSLKISIGNEGHPVNMEYFKFYIKDNSSEYYNLAMDRYYDGEDENIWISFPSSDRNKVDIDDFLILKKGADSTSLIKEAARYKIIDIKNEAPDNIKKTKYLIGTKRHSNTTSSSGTPTHAVFHSSDLPFEGDDTFTVDYELVKSSSFANLHNDFNSRPSDKYYITLSNEAINKVSERYEVISLAADNVVTTAHWYFHLKYPFGSEVNEFTDDPDGISSTRILDDTYLNIYKETIDDSLKFDGRFFVKIFNDEVFTRNIVEPIDNVKKTEYKAIPDSARKIFGLETDGTADRIKKHFDVSNNDPIVFKGANTDTSVNPPELSTNVIKNTDIEMRSWQSYIEATNKIGAYVGTLNAYGSFGTEGDDDNIVGGFMGSRWQHYDAYFRAFNVDPDGIDQRVEKMDVHGNDRGNQSFEDVWFFDKGSSAGQFENSNNSPSSGWDSLPNPGNGEGLGIINDREDFGAYIDLGFGGIQPNEWPNSLDGDQQSQSKPSGIDQYQHHSDSSFYDLSETNLNYSKTQKAFIKNLSVGSQFRFKEDPLGEIYTILDVDIKFKIRYEDITTGLIEGTGASGNQNFDFTVGSGINNLPAHPRVIQESCYPLQVLAKKGFGVRTPVYSGSGSNLDPNNIIQGTHGFGSTQSRSVVNSTDIHDASVGGGMYGRHGYYKTSSFLRASNFTKNWRIRLDKKLSWNPYGSAETELINGQTITVTPIAKSGSNRGTNFITIANVSLKTNQKGPVQKDQGVGTSFRKADPFSADNILEDVRDIQIGMVLTRNAADEAITSNFPVVSGIEKSANFTVIYFKNYSGGNNLTGGGASGDLSNAGTTALTFRQFPVNGLSTNSVKNLNLFRSAVGNAAGNSDGTLIGTEAVGYTMEFVEEMTQRPEEDILPANPAIFETEPKKLQTDLDIYHAMGDFIPIKINSAIDFIPIGSLIEHRNSSAIPYGTKVEAIDNNGKVTLSRTMLVDAPYTPTAGNLGGSNWGGNEKQ